eukprot:CAMPEP_0171985150 /NCGR_PEP_ID=MMETSP0993-20121228/274201_1 /TAXON_ID=483369 /ORGANISM="non described non described, Strain CCMP2098" /LENGTH=472 /DNA_ID=CAMNT_0012638003 /DNA_START=62 /DNA_END=1481 /DNA_ORIENTATION=+
MSQLAWTRTQTRTSDPVVMSVSRKPANEKREVEEREVLLYYKYVEPKWNAGEVQSMLVWQQEVAEANGLSGRIRIAPEGLNVNISGTKLALESYCTTLLSWGEGKLGFVDFKLAPTTRELEFRGLKCWQTKEVVGLGASVPEGTSGGRHISPQEFHSILEAEEASNGSSNVILLDARNLFEFRLGRFEVGNRDDQYMAAANSQNSSAAGTATAAPAASVPGIGPNAEHPPTTATAASTALAAKSVAGLVDHGSVVTYAPPTKEFSEFPQYVDALPAVVGGLKGKQVLLYCTGGVRCERASQYVRARHPEVGEVCQLAGGIHRYLEAYPDGGKYWRGLNYVFDRREVHGATVAPNLPAAEKTCGDAVSVAVADQQEGLPRSSSSPPPPPASAFATAPSSVAATVASVASLSPSANVISSSQRVGKGGPAIRGNGGAGAVEVSSSFATCAKAKVRTSALFFAASAALTTTVTVK